MNPSGSMDGSRRRHRGEGLEINGWRRIGRQNEIEGMGEGESSGQGYGRQRMEMNRTKSMDQAGGEA